ncbi:MAG: glycosyltransferase family 4 protein [Flavobacteriales bacterium]|jgi:glycosyltransferase involved in cell wall biosynthesis|nr:glycosyltransferase family 4 protein [Flavobacteriales bacterium]
MNLCYISYIYPNPEKPILGSFVEEQLAELSKNHNVHIITKGKSCWKCPEEEIVKGIHVHRLIAENPFVFNLQCFIKIISLNNKFSFDVIHSHFLGFLTVICGLTSKIIRKPFFVTAYGLGLDPTTASFLRKLSIKLSFKFAKKVINISHYTKSLSEYYAPKKKQVIITPGITLSKLKVTSNAKSFRKKWNLGNNIIILSVANLVWRKGIDIIMSVLPDIIKHHPHLKYVIIGKGQEKSNLKRLVKKYKLTKNVIFVGWVSDENLANFYNVSDIFVLMSRTKGAAVEGFGIVYAEAGAFGKPVIGGKSGGTSDVVIDGKTGFLIEPENKRLLKEKLLLLVENKNLRRQIGTHAKKYIYETHLWKYKVSQIIKLYSKFI